MSSLKRSCCRSGQSFIEQFVVGEVHHFFLIDTFSLKGRIMWSLRDVQWPQVCFFEKGFLQGCGFHSFKTSMIAIGANWGCIILQLSTWAALEPISRAYFMGLMGFSFSLFFWLGEKTTVILYIFCPEKTDVSWLLVEDELAFVWWWYLHSSSVQ